MSLTYAWDDSTVASFKAILGEQLDYYETATRMGSVLGENPPEPAFSLARALIYFPAHRPHLDDPGSQVYAPMVEMTDGQSHPETVGAATDATLAAWADALEVFADFPLIVARAADLLWLRRHGATPYRYAQAAQQAMRALWTYAGIPDVFRADYLVRALDIIREANIKREIAPAVGEVVAAAQQSLQSEHWNPGVSLRLIARLVALPKGEHPAELDDLIQAATDVYRRDPFILDAVFKLRLQLAGSDLERRKAIALEIVDLWKSAAKDAVPLIAFRHIEQAMAVARAEGLTDQIEALRLRSQELSRQDEDFAELSVDINIPADQVEAFIAQFVKGDDPRIWLGRFGSYCPVQKDREQVAEQVRTLMSQAPLRFLATGVRFNAQGFPIKYTVGGDEHFAQAVLDHDTEAITFWGVFASEVLDRMLANGRLTTQLIAETLVEGVFDAPLAAGVARAFEHYRQQRYEEALLCCIPRLEAALRLACMELGLVVYIDPGSAANGLGGFKGMGDFLHALVGRTPEHHRLFLKTLLADPVGINLRNRAMHGLMQDVSKQDAALVLHAAATLGRWQITVTENSGSTSA